MKTFGKLIILALFFGCFLWAAPAVAGRSRNGVLRHPRLWLSR